VKQVTTGRRNENPRMPVAPLNCRQLHRQSGCDRVHDKMTINLGGRAIEIMYLKGASAVWLPKERVVFSASARKVLFGHDFNGAACRGSAQISHA